MNRWFTPYQFSTCGCSLIPITTMITHFSLCINDNHHLKIYSTSNDNLFIWKIINPTSTSFDRIYPGQRYNKEEHVNSFIDITIKREEHVGILTDFQMKLLINRHRVTPFRYRIVQAFGATSRSSAFIHPAKWSRLHSALPCFIVWEHLSHTRKRITS